MNLKLTISLDAAESYIRLENNEVNGWSLNIYECEGLPDAIGKLQNAITEHPRLTRSQKEECLEFLGKKEGESMNESQLAQIKDEADCDISAGGKPKPSTNNYIWTYSIVYAGREHIGYVSVDTFNEATAFLQRQSAYVEITYLERFERARGV